MTKLENLKALAKDGVPSKDWLKNMREMAVKKRGVGTKYERHDRVDLRKMGGTEEEPEVLEVVCLTEPRTIKTEKMQKPMDVCDIQVVNSSVPDLAQAGNKYSIWANTTALAKEFKKVKEGARLAIASYGTVATQRSPKYYVFNFIELEE